MKPRCSFVVRLLTAFVVLLSCAGICAQVPCTITVRAIDTGRYDVFGENENVATTGLSTENRARGPYRSFMVFHIPPFPGVLTNASVGGYASSIGPSGVQTLNLHEVTNAAAAVRQRGFSATNIYADLGDGPIFGSQNFPSGFEYMTVSLSNGIAAMTAARGQDFVLGGDQSPLTSNPLYNDFIVFPYYSWSWLNLELQISAPPEPFIYTQPAVSLLYSNDSLVTVGACGAGPLTYNWYLNGTNYSSSGYPDLYISSLQGSNLPVFVIVTNSFGSITSAVTTVRSAPARLEWVDTDVALRTDSTAYLPLYVYAHNSPYPTLIWRKDGVAFYNPYFNTLELNQAQPSNSGNYTVVASNSAGMVTSAVMRVSVEDVAPRFWEQPRNTTNAVGDSYASFGVSAPGGPRPTFHWYREGVPVPNTNGAVLYFNSLTLSDAGNYYVVASNRAGMTTSEVARLEVILDPPVFTTHPSNVTTYPGWFVNLTVQFTGSPYPQLQWYRNDAPVPGAWYSNLPLGNIQPSDSGSYYCVASNASGVATSQVATVTVIAVPPVLSELGDQTVGAGYYVYLSLSVSNPPVCLQWWENNAPIPGSVYCISNGGFDFFTSQFLITGPSNYTTQISVVATNAFGVATSRVATITVTTAPPYFATAPADITVVEGSTLTIQNYAYGAPPPRQYLFRNGQDLGAYFNGTLRLFNITPAQSGEYTLLASNAYGTATSAPFRINVQRVGPLDRWTRRHPAPQGNDLRALLFAQNRYVAIGDVGTIITSINGTNWSVFSAEVPSNLEGIAYGNGRFVAVGSYLNQGIVVTSTNGDTWVTMNLPEASRLRGIAFGDGKFLAIGTGFGTPVAFASSNAVDWTALPVSTATTAPLDVVTYGNGRFVIGTDPGGVIFSANLLSWTNSYSSVLDPEGATFFNNHFTIVGNNGRMATSVDAVLWTPVTNGVTTRRLFAIAHGAGLHVAVGNRGTIISSASGSQFTWTNAVTPTNHRLEDLIHANGLFVAVGERGTIVTSYDGHQWIEQTRGVAEDLDGLAVSDNLAVAVGKNGTILTSTDGRGWTLAPLPVPPADSPADWHGVAFGDGKIVVVGESTNVLVSNDNGLSWHPHSYVASASYLKSVIYTQGMWVAVGIGGVILTSPDATNWTQQFSPVPYDLNDIAYGNGQFVVVGDQYPSPNATILVSIDGTNWINRSYSLSKNARAVTFQQGHFVLAGNDGRFLVTTNPLYWGPPSYSYYTYEGANHRDVTAHDRTWIAVGNNGIIITAPSTFTNGVGPWKPRQSRTAENLHGVRHFKGTFLAVGNRGLILQSGPLDSRLEIERDGSNLNLFFSSPHEGLHKLQETTDFQWQDAGFITNPFGTVRWPVPTSSPMKFYRVVPQ